MNWLGHVRLGKDNGSLMLDCVWTAVVENAARIAQNVMNVPDVQSYDQQNDRGGFVILVDSSVGSRELLSGIRSLGCDAELVNELSTDFQFSAFGESGAVLIGVERKTISDLLDSIRSRRLGGGQVGRALDTYDHYYLIVEGAWRRGEGGMLEVGFPWHQPKGQFRYAEVSHFLNRLRFLGGVYVWRTFSDDETIATLVDWHDQWQQPWEAHLDKRVIYAPAPVPPRQGKFFQPQATPVQKWLYQLPGMGDKKTFDLCRHFASPYEIADCENWSQFDGVGKAGEKKILEWIYGLSKG